MSGFTDFINQIAKNAIPDIANIAQGTMENYQAGINPVGYAAQQIGNAIQHPSQVIPNDINAIKGMVQPYANLVGAQVVPAEPGKGLFGKEIQFNPQAAKQNAIQHPITTALTAGSILGAMKGAGDIEAAHAPVKPPLTAENTQSYDSTIPVSDQKELPDIHSTENPGMLKKAAMSVNQVNKVQLPADINGAENEAAVRQVLNEDVPGNSLAQKYTNLGSTMDNISGKIQDALTQNSKQIPVNDNILPNGTTDPNTVSIHGAMMNRMQPLIDAGTITPMQAEQEVDSFINRMYASAVGKAGLPPIQNTVGPNGEILPSQNMQMPDTVSSTDAFAMKQTAQKAASSLFDKQNLSPSEQTTMALRNGMDDVITQYNPEVKQLTLKQSRLYDAVAPLAKLRNANTNIGIKLPVGIGGNPIDVNLPLSGYVRRGVAAALNNPKVPLALIGTGAAGAAVGAGPDKILHTVEGVMKNSIHQPNSTTDDSNGNAGNNINNNGVNEPNNQAHITSIPQSVKQIQPDQQGHFGVANPYDFNIGIDPQSYLQQKQQLEADKADPAYALNSYKDVNGQTVNYKQYVDGQEATLEAKKAVNDELQIPQKYAAVQQAIGEANNVMDLMKTAGPQLFQQFPTLDKLRQTTDPKYAQLYSAVVNAANDLGIDPNSIYTPQTTDVAKSKVVEATRNLLWKFYSGINTYNGSNTYTTGGQTTTTLPPPVSYQLPPTPQAQPAAPVPIRMGTPLQFAPTGQEFENQ